MFLKFYFQYVGNTRGSHMPVDGGHGDVVIDKKLFLQGESHYQTS